jgi:hypothetical protein
MAYGNGDKKLLHKALPAGSASLDASWLSTGKLGDLALLREGYLSAANAFVDAIFTEEPLHGTMPAEAMEKMLVAKQKQIVGLNKAYVEKARLSIPSLIGKIEKIYLCRIFGRLAHCASPIPATAGGNTTRKYFNIPEATQDQVSLPVLEKIETMTTSLGFKKTIELVAKVVGGDSTCIDSETALVIRAVHADCLERYRKPVFGADPQYTCQIHLDYRVIRGEDDPAKRLDAAARILVDSENKKFRTFLEISNPVPRGKAIRLPITMSSAVLQKFDRNASLGSLIVEIGPDAVQVKAVASKEAPAARDINSFDHFVSRDFGYKNTITLSVVRRDREIDPVELERILGFTKTDALKYLGSHSHPMDNIVARVRFSGQGFLAAINAKCQKIESLASQISLGYNKLERLKANICGYLELGADQRFTDGLLAQIDDPLVKRLYGKFYRLLHHVWSLKGQRLGLYAKIKKLKKTWFGFLSNQEVSLTTQYNAAVIREDLTVMAKEKDSPGYKGRVFNKMINNGSKGQYIRRARDKFLWDGVPEIAIPSFFTSTTCAAHAVVDATMRSGDRFWCPRCGKAEHADAHAADTIGNYLLLRPLAVT